MKLNFLPMAVGLVTVAAYCWANGAEPASKFASSIKSGLGGVAGSVRASDNVRVSRGVTGAGNHDRGTRKLPPSELASKRGQRELPAAELAGKRKTEKGILEFQKIEIDEFSAFAPGMGTGATRRTGSVGARGAVRTGN